MLLSNVFSINKNTFVVATTVFISFFLIGIMHLYRGHPFEDAFIVFKYAENLAKGNGIVYYPGGPRAEGYVDFLWISAIAILIRLGFDVAVAGLVINAFGAAIIAGLIQTRIQDFPRFLRWILPFSLLFSSAALVSYGGFSTMMHVAIVVFGFWLCLSNQSGHMLMLPWVSLVSALYRADGAVLGVGLSLCGLVLAWQKKTLKKYLLILVLAISLGLLYFFLRYHYFGLLLPLPLYVKNQGLIYGIAQNLEWFQNSLRGPIPLLFGVSVLVLWMFRKNSSEIARVFLALLPAGFLFASLCAADQLQNVYFRFQSPIFFLLFCALVRLSGVFLNQLKKHGQKLILGIIWLIVLIPMMYQGAASLKEAFFYQPAYLDTFAFKLASHLRPGKTMAITEAGRLAYWSHARVEDLHGLNTAYTALNPPNQSYFDQIHADLLMCQHMGLLNIEMLEREKKENDVLISLSKEKMREAVIPEMREMLEKDFEGYQPGENRSVISVMALIRYLLRAEDYDLWLAPYRSMHRPLRYWHLYAIRKDLPTKEKILEDLRTSVKGDFQSYAQLKHFIFT